jgi:hypothetical protein
MKFKKIVGFGDSWMWGDELLDPQLIDHPQAHPVLHQNTPYRESHCFLGLLGKHYNVPTENFGFPGGSMQSAVWCYLWWLENEPNPEECLVLVGHTDAARTSFYNPNHTSYTNDPPWHRFVHSSWIHAGTTAVQDEWHDMVKRYFVLTDCPQLTQLNYRQNVLFWDRPNVVQFCTQLPPLVAQAKNLLWPDRNVGDLVRRESNSREYFASGGHPNEKGHEVITKHLISHIDHVILA